MNCSAVYIQYFALTEDKPFQLSLVMNNHCLSCRQELRTSETKSETRIRTFLSTTCNTHNSGYFMYYAMQFRKILFQTML